MMLYETFLAVLLIVLIFKKMPFKVHQKYNLLTTIIYKRK